MNKSISIIVPVYNAAKTLEHTVGSILSGNFDGNCELILVDDGSTDESPSLCDRLSLLSPDIKVIHKPNGGVSDARNAGIEAAVGEYLMFVDSDDLLPKMALQRCCNALESGADLVVGGYSLRSLSGKTVTDVQSPLSDRIYSGWEINLFWDDNYSHRGSYLRPVWGKLFRRQTVCSGVPLRFQKGLGYGEDLLFLFEFICRCRRVTTISESLYIYRESNQGLSADLSSDRHLYQLVQLTGQYASLLDRVEKCFPDSRTVGQLRHRDLVGRLVCRALTVFATRRTVLCTSDNISRFYSLMKTDPQLIGLSGIFTLRMGQVPNLLLFKLGSPKLAEVFYRMSAAFCEFFKIRPQKY